MRLLCIGFLWLFTSYVKAQQHTDAQLLLNDAEASVFNNPNYGIKISEFTLNNNPKANIKCQSFYLLAKSQYIKGNYDEAFKNLTSAKSIAKQSNNTKIVSQINILIAEVLYQLDLFSLASYYLNEAKSHTNAETLNWISAKQLQNKTRLAYLEQNNKKEAISNLLSARSQFQASKSEIENLSPVELDLATFYLNRFQLDSALFYLDHLNTKQYQNNQYISMFRLNKYAAVLFQKKKFFSSIDSLKKAYTIAERFNHVPLKSKINEQLISNYIVTNNPSAFLKQNLNTTVLNNTTEQLKTEATNTVLNYTKADKTNTITELTASYKRNIIFLSISAALLLGFGLFYKYLRDKRIKQYLDILKYFETSKTVEISTEEEEEQSLPIKNVEIDTPPMQAAHKTVAAVAKPSLSIKSEDNKSPNIPKETENIILSRLQQFEKSNKFTSKDMSLGQLASKLDTNTKYLSEIINKTKGKNFNAYINELRIKYIIEKLKTEPKYLNYKVSYLAHESGFSSHSSFATVFKSVTGLSPTVFINIIKKEFKAQH